MGVGGLIGLHDPVWPETAPKSKYLHFASLTLMNVPRGWLLLDQDGWEEAILTGLPTQRRVAVRSAFDAEDGEARSQAGRFRTVLNVDPTDREALWEAVLAVRASGEGVAERRDVLLMEMVEAEIAGVAFAEPDYADDLVEWTTGLGDQLVGGEVTGTELELPRVWPGETRAKVLAGRPRWQMELAEELRLLRLKFGDTGWDVEWAWDGTTLWVLQIRRITAAPMRNEWLTMANHREILPDPPSRFMASLIEGRSRELFGFYRRFDPRLPNTRSFAEIWAGRAVINLSLMADLMRWWGLPTRLVTGSIGGEDLWGTGVNWRRLRAAVVPLARMGAWQSRPGAVKRAALAEMDAAIGEWRQGTGDVVDAAGRAYVALVHGMMALTAGASLPVAVLRRAGVLAEWSARLETPGTRMARDTGRLSEGEFRERWGHRGVFESDLAEPRFGERPPRTGQGRFEGVKPRLGLKALLFAPVWLSARGPMRAREELRDEAMRRFSELRTGLAAVPRFGELTTEEWRRAANGERFGAEFWAEREADRAALEAVWVPDVLRRFGGGATESATGDGTFGGIVLRPGLVRGRVWKVARPDEARAEQKPEGPVVLVVRSVDAGWVPLFGQVDAVVVEIGGDLSHGSIILRELGVVAMTNVKGVYGAVETGDEIEMDARLGRVSLFSSRGREGA